MSLLKKLAGETLIYGMGSILPRLLNYVIVTPYFTTKMRDDTGEYAIHGLMYGFATVLMVLLTYRMETAFFRFGSKKGMLDKTFSTATLSLLTTTILGFCLVYTFAGDISYVLMKDADPTYVRLFAMIIGFDVLSAIPFARLRLTGRPIRFAVLKLINVGITIAALFFFLEYIPMTAQDQINWACSWDDSSYRLFYIFLSNVLASGGIFLLLISEYRHLKWRFDTALWKRMLRYAAPLIIVGLAGTVNQLADRFLLPHWLSDDWNKSTDQAGIYFACVKIAVLMQLFTTAFNYAAEPFFFNHADRSDAKQIYAQVGQAFTMVASIVFLGIMLYLDVVQLLINNNFRAGLGVVPILLLAYLWLGLFYNFSIWYKITDRTKVGAYISSIGAVITLVLNYFLIPKIGYFASAWASFVCFGFMAAASYWVGKKEYPIPYPLKNMLGYVLLAVLVYGLSEWVRPLLPNLGSILATNTVLLLGYLGVLWRWERASIREVLK